MQVRPASPLIWSDELAQMLFIWRAMLDSVAALRRGEHMRMTTLVMKASPEILALLETLVLTSAVFFLGLVLMPAYP